MPALSKRRVLLTFICTAALAFGYVPLSMASADSSMHLTGVYYLDVWQQEGDATADVTIGPDRVTGTLQLSDLSLSIDLNRTGNQSVGTDVYNEYLGTADNGTTLFRTKLIWHPDYEIATVSIYFEDLTNAVAYLSPNSTAASELESAVMVNRTSYAHLESFEAPEPNLDTTVPLTLPQNITDPGIIPAVSASNITDPVLSTLDSLLEPDSSTSSSLSGTFYGGEGPTTTDHEGYQNHLVSVLSSWERNTKWKSSFDEVEIDEGFFKYLNAQQFMWHQGGSPPVDHGQSQTRVHIPGVAGDMHNPLRIYSIGATPREGDEEAQWTIDVGIGIGFVQIGVDSDINDQCEVRGWCGADGADGGYYYPDDAKITTEFHDADFLDTQRGDELPDNKETAHGLKAGWGSVDGTPGFYPVNIKGSIDYERTDCDWTDAEAWDGKCITTTGEVISSWGPIQHGEQVADWDTDTRIANSYDFDYGDRAITQHNEDNWHKYPRDRKTYHYYENRPGHDFDLYQWGRLEGPIHDGHSFDILTYKKENVGDKWDHVATTGSSFLDPGAGMAYEYVDIGQWIDYDALSVDQQTGHWKAVLYVDGYYLNTYTWTIGEHHIDWWEYAAVR